MKTYIYGAAQAGHDALIKMRDTYGLEPDGFLDTYKHGFFLEKPILELESTSPEDAVILAHDNIIVAAEMYERLSGAGYNNLWWFMNLKEAHGGESDFLRAECFPVRNWGSCVLPNLEVHLADCCNLNCRGCTHFSPLFHTVNVDFESRMEDIRKLRRKFTNIGRLDILGGEPLMNPELSRYLVSLRQLLPDTYLNIFTNGILLVTLDSACMRAMRENRVTVTVSEYPSVSRLLPRIISRLSEFQIGYRITPKRNQFNLPLTTNPATSHPRECISNGCICVENGRLARCPTLLYLYKFNETFHQSLPEEGILQLDDCPSGPELLTILKKDVPLCRYCVRNTIEWSVCGRHSELHDFASED